MDPTRLMTQECTIAHLTPNGADEYGLAPTSDVANTTAKCWLHQTMRTEKTVEADTQIETWQLYLPPGTTVDGSDHVTVDGDTFELIGPPWSAFNPRLQRVTHIECTLRKVA